MRPGRPGFRVGWRRGGTAGPAAFARHDVPGRAGRGAAHPVEPGLRRWPGFCAVAAMAPSLPFPSAVFPAVLPAVSAAPSAAPLPARLAALDATAWAASGLDAAATGFAGTLARTIDRVTAGAAGPRALPSIAVVPGAAVAGAAAPVAGVPAVGKASGRAPAGRLVLAAVAGSEPAGMPRWASPGVPDGVPAAGSSTSEAAAVAVFPVGVSGSSGSGPAQAGHVPSKPGIQAEDGPGRR